jgi:hypothetical protein
MQFNIYLFILGSILIIFSAFGKAVCDALSHHFNGSVFKNMDVRFWNPIESGGNKWKNGDRTKGEKFFLSSTLFVSFTEGWHIFDLVRNKFSIIGSLVLCYSVELNILYLALLSVYIFILFGMCFEFSYRKLTPGVVHKNYFTWLKKLKLKK